MGSRRGEPMRSRRSAFFPAVFSWVLRIGLAGLFVYAGGIKLADPAGFQGDINNYRLIPAAVAGAAALYLPWLEIIAGGAIFFRRWLGAALLVLGSLLVVFTVAIGSAWVRGIELYCGCFGGVGETTSHPLSIARNLLLLAVVGAIAMAEARRVVGNAGSEPAGELEDCAAPAGITPPTAR